jgi:hypothetical protein
MILLNRNLRRLLGLIILSILFLASPDFAQRGRGNLSMQGVVLSQEGTPIPGVKVIAVFSESKRTTFFNLDGRPWMESVLLLAQEKNGSGRREVISDENGRWAIRLMQSGLWKLQAFAENEISDVSDIVLRLSKNDIELVLIRSDMDFLIRAKMVMYENRWDLAIEILKLFEICFPESKQMDNAVYWLSFCQKQFSDSLEERSEKNKIYVEALQDLEQLIEKFPESEWKDDAQILRIEIALKLVQMGQGQYEHLILESMELPESEDISIRLAALDAYRHIDEKKAVQILMEMARTNADPEVRKKSVYILGSVGGKDLFSFLQKIVDEDPDESVRRAAGIWLKR